MKNRKGITPIIAIVLLLMMTVAAAGLAWQFIQNTMSDAQKQVKDLDINRAPPKVVACVGDSTGNGGSEMYLLVQVPGPNITFNTEGMVVYTNGEKDVIAMSQLANYIDTTTASFNPLGASSSHPNCFNPGTVVGENRMCWIKLNLGSSGVDTTFPRPGESYTIELTLPQMNNLKLAYTCSPTKAANPVVA